LQKKWLILSLLILFTLSGCLYPEERKTQNRMPYQDQITAVQTAVENFQKDTGVLPIKTKEADTDIYQKYLIDFNKLVPKYMQEPPGNSFEKGGTFQYVLINVETKPTVKLADLVLTDKVQDVQVALNIYMAKHQYPPFKKIEAQGRYTLDYKKLGFKEDPFVKSPFTGKKLPLMVNGDAKIFIDYRRDLNPAIESYKDELDKHEDIRHLLAEHSFFVPIYSVPYQAENNKPVFLIK
jgi:adenine-specific DNA methylase